MTRFQRFENIIIGLVMLLSGIVMTVDPEDGFPFIAMLLVLSMLFTGIRTLAFYFSMARFMVGGRSILFAGVFILDFSLYAASLTDEPRVFILVYLVMFHAFYGVVNLLKGILERRTGVASWRTGILQGTGNLIILMASILFLRSEKILVWIYCAGLFYTAAVRIITGFRRTDMVYIQ